MYGPLKLFAMRREVAVTTADQIKRRARVNSGSRPRVVIGGTRGM